MFRAVVETTQLSGGGKGASMKKTLVLASVLGAGMILAGCESENNKYDNRSMPHSSSGSRSDSDSASMSGSRSGSGSASGSGSVSGSGRTSGGMSGSGTG